jgi:serine/threonine protein kinase
VLDWGLAEEGDTEIPFFVMPLFPTTLGRMMRDGIPPDQVVHWFSKMIDGIVETHRLGVCHRDIKPKNILCDPSKDVLVVTDFGISLFAEPLLHTLVETSAGEKLANFDYAAPEQHRPGRVDHKADVWALGLILNEMFTGQVPHGKGHKLIAEVMPTCGYLDLLVDRMMQASPDERPDIGSIRDALRFAGIRRRADGTVDVTKSGGHALEAVPSGDSIAGQENHLYVSSAEDLQFHVEPHRSETAGTADGLHFHVVNDRPKNLKNCRVVAVDARSFDAKRSTFRDGFGFKAPMLGGYTEVLAGDSTKNEWLIRIHDGHLEVGNTTSEGVLRWPAGDRSDTEIWLLTFAIRADSLEPWEFQMRVEWSRRSNALRASLAEAGNSE